MKRTLCVAAVAAVIGIGVSAGVVYSQDGRDQSAGGEQPGGEAGGGGLSQEDMEIWMKYSTLGPEQAQMAAMAGTGDVAGKMGGRRVRRRSRRPGRRPSR